MANAIRKLDYDMRLIEQKQARAERVLASAYRRADTTAPRHNGRRFVGLVHDAAADEEGEGDQEFEQRLHYFACFIRFLFADGPRPDRVVKRAFAVAYASDREKSLLGMNLREIGDLLGETRAASSNRVNVQVSDFLRMWGHRATRVNGQKREHTRETFRALAMGNTSRKWGRKKGERKKQHRP